MLLNLDPVLTGRMLLALDEMGHGDAVVIADAHFTAAKLARKHLIDVPGLPSPRVLTAIRSVVVPDTYGPALDLMAAPDGVLPVQEELMAAAGLDVAATRFIERFAFYDLAAEAELIIRTGETRIYGNAIFRKGVTPVVSA
ncbi:MAG: transport protein RbsD/FucU [Actinobacteria bacterium]|nr:transport protein RbsD/FucU [Actinomycetota bacterium]